MNSQTLTSPSTHLAEDTVLVAAAGRSGQTWLCFLLAHLLNARFVEPYCLLRGIVFTGHPYILDLTRGSQADRPPTRYSLVVKTHQPPDPYYSLTKKLVIIVRDPRDMITSACLRFHVMKTTGSDIEEDAQGLSLSVNQIPSKQGLKDRLWKIFYGSRKLSIVLTARKWRFFHSAWTKLPFCHVVRYEDLLKEPLATMRKLCDYLELDATDDQINDTLNKLSFEQITGRRSGEENNKSIMFRKAAIGDYRNKLSKLEQIIVRHYCKDQAAQFGYQF